MIGELDRALRALVASGRPSVDDFGRGYSIFTYLRDLSLNGLKIETGCELGQGYRSAGPLPAEDVVTVIED